MKIGVVAAMLTAATVVSVAAAYGVGILVGVQVADSSGALDESEPPAAVGDPDERPHLHDAWAILGSFDAAGSVAVYCAQGELSLGGGRLGPSGRLRSVGDGPIAGSTGATDPIGWRIEVERTDFDPSPLIFAGYVVCRAG